MNLIFRNKIAILGILLVGLGIIFSLVVWCVFARAWQFQIDQLFQLGVFVIIGWQNDIFPSFDPLLYGTIGLIYIQFIPPTSIGGIDPLLFLILSLICVAIGTSLIISQLKVTSKEKVDEKIRIVFNK